MTDSAKHLFYENLRLPIVSEPADRVSIGLADCSLYHPVDYNHNVKITFGPPLKFLRHFPERVQSGLGICLKYGPADGVKAFGRIIEYPADSICVTPPGSVWEGVPSPAGFLSIDIELPLIQPDHRLSDQIQFFRQGKFPSIEPVVHTLTSSADRLEKDEALFELISVFSKHEAKSYREDSKIAFVRDVIHSQFDQRITLDYLAHVSNINKFTLIRKFRRRYGLTPYSYQVKLRLEASHKFLSQGLDAVKTAYRLGFSDQSHFGRFFKRQYGLTPKAYHRKTHVM
jgi:AraC-like DNA-binding protein